MKRHAFTMIELIFVIVILGILAAVAIPRMVGIQDDAKVASEQGTIGGVRGGISTARGTCLTRNWAEANPTTPRNYDGRPVRFATGCWMVDLETEQNGTAGTADVFMNVLAENVDDWEEYAAQQYEGPASNKDTGSAEADFELNVTGGWTYNMGNGRITYGTDTH